MCSSGSGTTQDTQRSQAQFSNYLQDAFKSQFGANTRMASFLNQQMFHEIGQGFSAPALAAMRANATDTIANQYQHAEQALNEQEAQRGGENLPSGVNAQLDEALLAREAEMQAGAQNDITLQNEQQRQANYWRAIGTLSGNNAARNPLGFASAANQGAGVGAELSNANTAANDSGLGGAFSKSFGSALGNAASTALVGDGSL